ncbi:MAG TPA: DUF2085 domain-containing protein [Roseiflexaceae bacterium]|nr:DUF2085 domain-containing protein [Roseiflexaceae bacterium]
MRRHGDADLASPHLRVSPSHTLTAILAVLFFGPLIAPLFQATYLPLVADSGALAHDLLSRYICPTPAKSYVLLGFPMAVCARCWGATIGLWAAWLLLQPMTSDQRPMLVSSGSSFVVGGWSFVQMWLKGYLALSWPLRLLVSVIPFLLWLAEIGWWPAAPLWLLLLNGAFAGFWAGLFFCSIWPGLLVKRQRADARLHYQ